MALICWGRACARQPARLRHERFIAVELGAKQLRLLHGLRPGAARIAVLVYPSWLPVRAVPSNCALISP
jgi:hypothetical protein